MQNCSGCRRVLPTVKSMSANLTRIYMDKPPKIELPPEPTTCCMSGCANCVWIEYAREISQMFQDNDDKLRQIILSKISDPNLKSFLSLELRTGQHKIKK